MSVTTFETVTTSEEETRSLGKRIGQQIPPGTVIGIDGSLGVGKTRLVQGIGEGLGIEPGLIVSPTYTICIPYVGRLQLLHLDIYRINDATEIDELGLDELVEDGVVIVIEWADRMKFALPPIDVEVFIIPCESTPNSRAIRIRAAEHQSLLREL